MSSDGSNVVDLAAAAKKRGKTLPVRSASTVQITGNNSVGIAGDGNHVEINVKTTPQRRPRISVQAGPGNITEEQAADIQELVAKVVDVTGKPFPFVWTTLKRTFRFASYRLLPQEQFESVSKYLRQWIASSKGQVLHANDDDARKYLLKRLHAEARKRKALMGNIRAYVFDRFGTETLSRLSPSQLNEVIKHFRL